MRWLLIPFAGATTVITGLAGLVGWRAWQEHRRRQRQRERLNALLQDYYGNLRIARAGARKMER